MREKQEMSDPLRLGQENASALEQALLAAGRSYGSSASTRAKTMAALGVAGSATLLAGTAQAVPLGTLAQTLVKTTWGKILAAVSLVGRRRGGSRLLRLAAPPGGQAGVGAACAAGEAGPSVAGTRGCAGRADRARCRGASGGSTAAAPADETGAPTRGGDRSATLAHELSTLDAARGMLARGDSGGALARLDRYAHAYPHGRLALEAEVLRIDALDAAGRTDAARARAQTFIDRHPHSVLAARVRTRLGD